MKRALKIAPLLLFGLLCLVYLADYAVLKYRVAENRGALGTVTVYSYYAIQKKGNKVEYVFNGTQNETCVHTLFPHMGYAPCWYVERHREQRTDI